MEVAIYARKSTESEDRQIHSLDDQIQVLKGLAAREGFHIQETLIESRSAKAPGTRPEFQRLVDLIQNGKIDGVLTWSINRLSRNLVDGGLVAHLLQTEKLKFIRTPERVYRPEDNVLIMSIENGMATGFVQDLSRSVKRGMQSRAERGWLPGPAPLGYVNNSKTHEIEPDPDSYHLIRKGWELMLSGGYKVSEVYVELSKLGLKGVHKQTRNGPVSKTVMYRVFSNPFYAGRFTFRGELIQGKHLQMVSEAEYEAVQVILGRVPDRRYRKHTHTFAGLLRCKVCGGSIVGETRKKLYKGTNREAVYIYYHCTGVKGCSKAGTREELLIESLLEICDSIKIDSPFAKWTLETMQSLASNDLQSNEATRAFNAATIAKLEEKLSVVRNMRIEGEIGAQEFAEMKLPIETQLAEQKKQSKDLSSEKDSILTYVRGKLAAAEKAGDVRELTVEGIRGMIQGLGDNHFLNLGKAEFDVDPIITKIATFEPRKRCSESLNEGDLLCTNPIWLALVSSIRNLARDQIRSKSAPGGEYRSLHRRYRFRQKVDNSSTVQL